MSSLCGICRPHGAPVEPSEIAAMLDALNHWRADMRGQWSADGIGLGHLLLRATPQSLYESLPVHDAEAGLAITGDFRLDNRDALAEQLGIPRAGLEHWPDGRLALRAYREWGAECAARLDGDFAFSVWDARRHELFCARDRIGVKPFYYVHHAGTFAFATEMKGLLALPFVERSVDETWIADYLHHLAIDREATFYAHIRRLAPAHTLTFTADGVRTRQYWTPDAHRELRLSRDEDYVDGFREKLVRAIRRRVDAPFDIGAELSGGLDSSAICAVAQRVLRDRGERLATFSQVRAPGMEDAAGRPPDFRWAIDSVVRHAGIDRVCLLEGEGGVLEAAAWANQYHDEPPRDSSSLYNHDLYDAAAARGVRVLLSGFGGNQCASAGGHGRRRELLRQGRWIQLWHELAAEKGRHPLLAALALGVRELDGPLADRMLKRGITWQAHATRPSRDDFARRIGIRQRTLQAGRLRRPPAGLRAQAVHLLSAPGVALRLEHANLPTAARRIEYRYPLLDVELISFCLAVPSRLKYSRGIDRYLFRRSLDGWLPDDVRMAAGPRGSANPGNYARKRRDHEALMARLHALAPDNPVFAYLDLEKLQRQKRIPNRFPRERHSDILRALALEHRLRALAESPSRTRT